MIVEKGIREELRWFYEARFGMFVHFGLYAMIGRGEWVMYHENIPRSEYVKLADSFDPSRFNADEWVKLAEDAGARYITVTAKHHDGFCLFDSALTDFKITNTPFGRDLIGELIAACQRRDMRIILYYSQPDWNHPNYVHNSGAFKDLPCPPKEDRPDWPAYVRYYIGQVEELCTKYGKIDGIWFDGSHKTVEEWKGREVYELIKRYQPHAVVNERARYGDFFTPERWLPDDLTGYMFEACESVSPVAWGYREDSSSFSVPHLVRSLVKMAAAGGNYLLNVGPAPDGTIPAKQAVVMREIGKWMKANGRAVYGTEPLMLGIPKVKVKNNRIDFAALKGLYGYTAKENSIYFHCMEWPESDRLIIPGITGKVREVRLIGAGDGNKNIEFRQDEAGIELVDLPCIPSDALVKIFEILFDQKPEVQERVKEEKPIVITAAAPDMITVLNAGSAHFEGYGVKGTKLVLSETPAQGKARLPAPNVSALPQPAQAAKPAVCITGWWVPEQKAIWRVNCEKAGIYDVFISAGAPEADSGAVIRVKAGEKVFTVDMPVIIKKWDVTAEPEKPEREEDSLLEGSVMSDAGFSIVKAGTAELPAGISDIIVSPEKLKWGYIFGKVEKLILKPRSRKQ
ncbi:MAG: alpha-L-fucosidase [Eubacteriales bacterium]|nr:alpha-L-fucosidase [Eubacteriales bacterium]